VATERKLILRFRDFEHPRLVRTEFSHDAITDSPIHHDCKGTPGQQALAFFLVQSRLSTTRGPFVLHADGENTAIVKTLWEVFRRPELNAWLLEMFGKKKGEHPDSIMASSLFKQHGKKKSSSMKIELDSVSLPPSCIHVFWSRGDEIDQKEPGDEVGDRGRLLKLAEQLRNNFNRSKRARPSEHPPAPKLDATCFVSRYDATPDMMQETKDYQKLVFLGISHQQLAGLFKRILQSLGSEETLPWESVEVYFVRDDIGEVYERKEFHDHLRAARQQIAEVLINELTKLPKLKEVAFNQSNSTRSVTGCLLGRSGPKPDFHVGYLPITVPPGIPDEAPTLKLSTLGGEESRRAIREALLKLYEALRDNHQSLGTFQRTLWDLSVSEWSDFCASSVVQQNGMLKLVEYAEFKSKEQVLELAAGTGHLSHFLIDGLEQASDGRLTVLDGSPGMLRAARKNLGNRVDYALCLLPSAADDKGTFADPRDIDIRGKQFDSIVIYQALFSVANSEAGLVRIARWCADHLKPNGRVILSAHNTAVKLTTSPPFDREKDPLRKALREIAREMKLSEHVRKIEATALTEENVVGAFTRASFAVGRPSKTYMFPNPNSERYKMWRVLAILDSFIDVDAIGLERARELVKRAITSLGPDLPASGRAVACWEFVLKKTP
jgi:ubiquinone/menaquinone biosynthesis C-methylase UbiE